MGFHWSGGIDKLMKKPDVRVERPSLGYNGYSSSTGVLNQIHGNASGMKTSASFATAEYYTGGAGSSGSGGGASRSIEAMRVHQVCNKINSMLKEHDMRQAAGENYTANASSSVLAYCIQVPIKQEDVTHSNASDGNANVEVGVNRAPIIDISVAIRWKNLVKDLMLLPDSVITRDVLQLFHRTLVVHDGFLNIALPIVENPAASSSSSSSSSSSGGGSRMENLVRAVLPSTQAPSNGQNPKDIALWNNFVEVHQVC